MKQNDSNKDLFNKIDVILHGQETIGSAERSCDKEEMKWNFLNQTDGRYANLLFNKFGKERVMNELEEFLSHDFFPRYGGGIGMTRMARAMKLEGLI
jgi:aspartyl/asparaginyl-tRNA synthetase